MWIRSFFSLLFPEGPAAGAIGFFPERLRARRFGVAAIVFPQWEKMLWARISDRVSTCFLLCNRLNLKLDLFFRLP